KVSVAQRRISSGLRPSSRAFNSWRSMPDGSIAVLRRASVISNCETLTRVLGPNNPRERADACGRALVKDAKPKKKRAEPRGSALFTLPHPTCPQSHYPVQPRVDSARSSPRRKSESSDRDVLPRHVLEEKARPWLLYFRSPHLFKS